MRYMLKCLTALLAVIILTGTAHATQNVVYPMGTKKVTVPLNQYINISASGASAKISKQVGGPSSNSAPGFTPETTVTGGILTNREVTFGPYSVATDILIEAGADPVYYSVGALASTLPVLRTSPHIVYTQADPVPYTATLTVTASAIMGGILTATQATGATITLTLPTGALMEAAAGIQVGQGFEWSVINLSAAAADTVTIAAGSGHTVVGTMVVASAHASTGLLYGNAARFLTRKTATDTFITYRIR